MSSISFRNNDDACGFIDGKQARTSKIGCFAAPVTWCQLAGLISSIRMYDRALSDDEIAHNFKLDKIRFGNM